MKRHLALLWACVLVLAALLAGCTASASSGVAAPAAAARAPEPVRAPEAVPDRQHIALSLPMDPGSLDPAHATDQEAFAVLGNVLEGLVRATSGGEPAPGVAARWTVEDGVRYTFHLRPDARWSDGQPVTAHDFVYAWLRALDPLTGADFAYQLYYIRGAEAFNTLDPADPEFEAAYESLRAAVAVDAPDDRTLQVVLEAPAAHWLALTAFPTYYPVREDAVARHGAQFGRGLSAMVYNGPFVITWWEPDQKLALRRNEHYWGAASVRLEQADFVILRDGDTAVRRFEAGELDRTVLPAALLPRYPAGEHRVLSRMAAASTWYLVVNTNHPELGRPDLRQAISLSLDRRDLVTEALAGGALPAEGLVPPVLEDSALRKTSGVHLQPGPGYAEAELLWLAYFKETGRDRLPLRLVAPNTSTAGRVTARVKAQLEKVLPGLMIEVVLLDQRDLLQRIRTGDFDLAFSGAGADYRDPLTFLELWLSDSALNHTGWADSEFDAAVRLAQSAPLGAERTGALAAAEAQLLRGLPVIPLYHPAVYQVTRPWLKGVQDFPLGAVLDLSGAYVEGRPK
jgi:oligopeptide transport system substrate-binding protein